jgi:hypothetical protein
LTWPQTGEDNKPTFFGENGDAPLRIPVRITNDALPDAASFLGTTTPPLVQSGATYPVEVRVRWMGRDTLPAATAVLTYQLLPLDGEQTVATGTVSLNQALAPGQSVTARANVRFADASGSAIVAAYPEAAAAVPGAASAYRLRWLLTRTNTTEAVTGAFEERVAVYPDAREAALFALPGKVPATLAGGRTRYRAPYRTKHRTDQMGQGRTIRGLPLVFPGRHRGPLAPAHHGRH